MNDLILDLYQKDCIKLGNFKLKNNDTSPIYIDMKNIISYPYIVNSIVSMFGEKILKTNFKRVCGIPYGGMHIASIVSYKYNYPLLLLRKETKSYGTKKNLEGEFYDNEKCIVFEDVITTGSSLVQYLKILTRHKIVVNDVFVICDRKHTKNDLLLQYNLHVLFTMYDVLNILMINSVINIEQLQNLTAFVTNNSKKTYKYSYKYRKKLTQNLMLKELFDIVDSKCSLLILNCSNIRDPKIIIQYVSLLGDHICLLHINTNIINNLSTSVLDGLSKLSQHHKFKIMDTFTDKINNLSDILLVDGLQINNNIIIKNKAVILKTNIDKVDNIQDSVTKYCHNYAKENKDFMIGLSSKNIFDKDESLIYISPEIDRNTTHVNKTTGIYQDLFENNIDLITLGEDFIKLPNIAEKIVMIKKMTWTVYLNSIRYVGNNFSP